MANNTNCNDNLNCLGKSVLSECVEYSGPSNEKLGIESGMSMNEVMELLIGNAVPADRGALNTDEVISKAKITSTSAVSVCAQELTSRDFKYTLDVSSSTSVFTYDLTPTTADLPVGHVLRSVDVRAYGGKTNVGSLITSNQNQSGGFSLPVNKYPITIEIRVRVSTDCGDVSLEKSVFLSSPSDAGEYIGVFSAIDLNQNAKVDTTLTSQLNQLNAGLTNLKNKVDSLSTSQLQSSVSNLAIEVAGLSLNEGSPSDLSAQNSSDISALESEIIGLNEQILAMSIETEALRSTVDSLNKLA